MAKTAEDQAAAIEPISTAECQAAVVDPKSPVKNKAGGSQVGSPQRLFPARNLLKRPATAARSLLANGLSSPNLGASVRGLPDGWSSFKKVRKDGASANQVDTYYKAPMGKVFPSLSQAKKYVRRLAIEDKQ